MASNRRQTTKQNRRHNQGKKSISTQMERKRGFL